MDQASKPLSGAHKASGLVARAYHEIKARILSNHYPGNHTALESALAEDLGMSRTPVREALIRLERERLVEVIPRRGMRVLPVSAGEMREIYEVLTCLEAQAAWRLATANPDHRKLQPMFDAVSDMEAALRHRDLNRWARGDEAFHTHLLKLAGNERLSDLAATVADQAQRTRMITLHLRPPPTRSNDDHRALLKAIAAGDADLARDIHTRHRRQAMNVLCGLLEQLESDGL